MHLFQVDATSPNGYRYIGTFPLEEIPNVVKELHITDYETTGW